MRVGVIGAGIIGSLRAQVVRADAGATLAGIADVRRESAEKLSASLGTLAHADYRRLLAEGQLDAVIVSSPAHLHAEMCLAAFEHGCHVLCEKPLSNTVESCRQIVQGARSAGKKLAVGFNHRFLPSFQFLKRCLDEGRIGTVDFLRVHGGHDGLANFRQEWMYRRPESGGGAMMDVGIHMTDLTRFLVGEIQTVCGVATERVWMVDGSEDNAMAIFTAQSGVVVQYQANWTEWKGYRCSIEACGDRGMAGASYGPMRNWLITQEKPGGPRRKQVNYHPRVALREKFLGWQTTTRLTFADEWRDFQRMLRGEPVHLAEGHDGLQAVVLANAVQSSRGTTCTLASPAAV